MKGKYIVIPYIANFSSSHAIPIELQIIAYVYLIVGLGGALYIVYDNKRGHNQIMSIMNVVWSTTVFYLGPLGLWAYWH
jgi:hypothetical protein